jgi:hypothetical protein
LQTAPDIGAIRPMMAARYSPASWICCRSVAIQKWSSVRRMILSIVTSTGVSAVKMVLITTRPHSLKIPTIGDCRNWLLPK